MAEYQGKSMICCSVGEESLKRNLWNLLSKTWHRAADTACRRIPSSCWLTMQMCRRTWSFRKDNRPTIITYWIAGKNKWNIAKTIGNRPKTVGNTAEYFCFWRRWSSGRERTDELDKEIDETHPLWEYVKDKGGDIAVAGATAGIPILYGAFKAYLLSKGIMLP